MTTPEKFTEKDFLSPELPDGNYHIEGATASLFSISDHKTKKGLKEIQISGYNFPVSFPAKLLYGLNFEKIKNFCDKWWKHSVRTRIWQNVELISGHMAKAYQKASNQDWKKFGTDFFDQAVSETLKDENDFGIRFDYVKEIYGGMLESKKPFLHPQHSMKDQLAFKKKYGRFMYPEENLKIPKTITLFKEEIKIVVGSLFVLPGTEQKLLICKNEERLRASIPSRRGNFRYWDTRSCNKPIQETFLKQIPVNMAFKYLDFDMEIFDSFFKIEENFKNDNKFSVFYDFCVKHNISTAKVEYLTVKNKNPEEKGVARLFEFKNVPVIILRNPVNHRYWYKNGDISYILATGTLPNSIQKAKSLFEQQNKDWTTNLTTKEPER